MAAALSCSTCRKQKRRCSRELPTCELCRKNRRTCSYPPEALNTDIGVVANSSQNEFPRLFFLDSFLYEYMKTTLRAPFRGLPPNFASLLENESALQNAVNGYFNSTHQYFPIVSKLRLYQKLDQSPWKSQPVDVVLLIIIMQLFTNAEDAHRTTQDLYCTIKQLVANLEARGLLTCRFLQAYTLLTLYELGHGIYPAAYLSVGHCARLGQVIGLHDRRSTPQLAQSGSWAENEEQGRIWWGILLLDRYTSIGLCGRPFAIEDATPDAILPQSDTQWDSGELSIRPSLAVSALVDTGIPISPFARTCQAAHLLSRVLSHVNSQPQDRGDMLSWYQAGGQIAKVVESFRAAIVYEAECPIHDVDTSTIPSSLDSARGLVYSALIVLYDAHSCAEKDYPGGIGSPEQLSIQRISLEGILRLCCNEVVGFALSVSDRIREKGMGDISPFIADSFYAAARHQIWYWKETQKAELLDSIRDTTKALRTLGRFWNVAGEYLRILEEFQEH
ncbi:hypothetical protein F5Y19DRAFT_428622 [Xylariaceae sp. FL1651]|nr:hypothetical protein F5Y19DRAFT_428622 [Xylariaceae sp. FL1651]